LTKRASQTGRKEIFMEEKILAEEIALRIIHDLDIEMENDLRRQGEEDGIE
jgi:hypothetical protein